MDLNCSILYIYENNIIIIIIIIYIMDSSTNLYEEYIRPPDISRRETLLQDTKSDFDKQLEEALYQSLQLYQNEVKKNEEYEQSINQEEIEHRKKFVHPILFELNRIRKYDSKINDIYEIIHPILELYCNLEYEKYTIDKQTYNTIINGLSRTRINIDVLLSIIQCE